MENAGDYATITMQMALNKKMYETGRVNHDTYSRANEILTSRLTSAKNNDIIIHSEHK